MMAFRCAQLAIRWLVGMMLLLVTALACPSPKRLAMQSVLAGWGDAGVAQLVDSPTHGGPYSLRIDWSDQPQTADAFWVLGWPTKPPTGYDTLSVDVFIEQVSGPAKLTIYLTERDGDRWPLGIDLSTQPTGQWITLSATRQDIVLWALGDGKPAWDTARSVTVEPSGPGASCRVYLDNLRLAGKDGIRNLLDPDSVPRPYTGRPPHRAPLNQVSPAGHAFIAGSAGFWTNPQTRGIIDRLCATSPRVAFSANGFAGHEQGAWLSAALAAHGRPLMQEHADAWDFAIELTEQQAWCVRWDGQSNNTTPGAFDPMHTACFGHSAYMEMQKRRVDAMLAAGIRTLTLVDYVFPYWGGRWGYSEADIADYRRILSGSDPGLLLRVNGRLRRVRFWEYFHDYAGFVWKPADLGLDDWSQYRPVTEQEADADDGLKRRNLYLFVTLNHYQWLRFLDELGGYLKDRGGRLWIIPNPEDLANAADYIYVARMANVEGNLPEYFGNPIWTAALYRSGRYLSHAAHTAGNLIGPQFETNAGGHGKPYYDPQVAYAACYDVCAALQADVIKNDFLDETPVEIVTSPEHPAQFERYVDTFSKVYAFDRMRIDRPVRSSSSVAVVTKRNINRYRGSIFYTLGATEQHNDGSLADAMAREQMIYDLMDSTRFSEWPRYRTLVWADPLISPAVRQRLRDWLKSGRNRTLICHSDQPLCVDQGLNPVPWWRQVGIRHTSDCRDWGIPSIHELPTRGGSGHITAITGPFATVFRRGETIDLPPSRFDVPGGTVLLAAEGIPLVSEFRLSGGARVIYLHYRAGDPDTLALDRRVIRALLPPDIAPRAAETNDRLLVHRYQTGTGAACVLWSRDALDRWQFIYDGNRNQRLTYSQPDIRETATLRVRPGRYLLYDLLSGSLKRVQSNGRIDLPLTGVACAVVYILPDTPAGRDRLGRLQAAPELSLWTAWAQSRGRAR